MTRFELRRLALRASRNPAEWRPVLQDALLETYGRSAEELLRRAHMYARSFSSGTYYVTIVFDPRSVARRPLEMYTLRPEDFDPTWPDSWARLFQRTGRFIAFIVPPGRPRDAV